MRLSGINGNIDTTKILPHIKTAQDMQLQPVLGTKLLTKCQQYVDSGDYYNDTEPDYNVLINDYITPCLVFYSLAAYFPFQLYEIANGGIYRHQSENSITSDKNEMEALAAKSLNNAQFYGRRLNDYLCEKGSKTYPELNENTGADFSPGTRQISNQWHI